MGPGLEDWLGEYLWAYRGLVYAQMLTLLLLAFRARRSVVRVFSEAGAGVIAVALVAGAIRLLAADLEAWPDPEGTAYPFQAMCMAFRTALEGVTRCGSGLFGDEHQLGYTAWVSMLFVVFGPSQLLAGLVTLGITLATGPILFVLCRRLFASPIVAWAAVLLHLATQPVLAYTVHTSSEPAFDLFLLIGLLVWLEARDAREAVPWIREVADALGIGFFAGSLAQIRPELGAFLVLFGIDFARSLNRGRRAWKTVAAFAVGAVVAMTLSWPHIAANLREGASAANVLPRTPELLGAFHRKVFDGNPALAAIAVGSILFVAVRLRSLSREVRAVMVALAFLTASMLYSMLAIPHSALSDQHMLIHFVLPLVLIEAVTADVILARLKAGTTTIVARWPRLLVAAETAFALVVSLMLAAPGVVAVHSAYGRRPAHFLGYDPSAFSDLVRALPPGSTVASLDLPHHDQQLLINVWRESRQSSAPEVETFWNSEACRVQPGWVLAATRWDPQRPHPAALHPEGRLRAEGLLEGLGLALEPLPGTARHALWRVVEVPGRAGLVRRPPASCWPWPRPGQE